MVFAHGIGGSQDLPISLPFALAGGAAALAVSFIVLIVAWRTPRFEAATHGLPLPAGFARAVDSGALPVALRAAGLLFTAYVTWAALAGPDNLANPTFGVVYVLLWVGIVPASLLFGPFYGAVNPVRTLHALVSRLTGGDPGEGVLRLPSWVGVWPAGLGLLAFVWLELVAPDQEFLWTIRLWFAGYFAVVFVGATVFGDRWITAADPFEAYSTLVGHLSPFGRTTDGTLVVRSPLQNLDGVPAVPGLVAVVAVLVGSTAFDSFQDSLPWVRFSQDLPVGDVLLGSLALVAFCVVVGALFAVATTAAPPTDGIRRSHLPRLYAHSLVPIVVGYMVAHYLSYFVEVGQQTLIYLSDPMVDGSNYLGTADLQVSYWLSLHPTFLATSKVVAIVGGHVLGVIASHDRAMRLLPLRHRLTGQLPLLAVMVVYTISGLYLLLTV
ncbi:MAG TPA: hypothetical protein VFG72_04290 [Marmoricola sp.]|nr:hypothetical protein [Marmoricola sp.]